MKYNLMVVSSFQTFLIHASVTRCRGSCIPSSSLFDEVAPRLNLENLNRDKKTQTNHYFIYNDSGLIL